MDMAVTATKLCSDDFGFLKETSTMRMEEALGICSLGGRKATEKMTTPQKTVCVYLEGVECGTTVTENCVAANLGPI